MKMGRILGKLIVEILCGVAITGVTSVLSHAESITLDLSTLIGKHVAGYQGWFSCPQDGSGIGWRHWFSGNHPRSHNLVIDMWPDTSELGPDELCPTGLTMRPGKPAYLYSAENRKTVARHFQWMRDYGIDGVALERFASELKNAQTISFVNTVLNNVRVGAEEAQRGFFVMYDLSGSDSDVVNRVSGDWNELTESMHMTESPSYMRHRGKPIVGLWGIGVIDRPITTEQASALITFFRNATVPATIVGGVPAYWRTLDKDSHSDREWAAVYRSLDVISPWTVGRFHDAAQADQFLKQQTIPDMAEAKRNGIDYMPVIFPGMSWYNGQRGRVTLNVIPRDCGRQHQAQDVIKSGANMVYSAMFDEVNEGTALYKVVTQQDQTPKDARLVTLDDGACHVASDWYLHLAGEVSQALRQKNP
jgi:hypothetical protein